MFTPQSQRTRKGPWTPISSGAPSTLAGGRPSTSSKGKAVAFVDGPSQHLTPLQTQPMSSLPPPPLGSLTENKVASVYDDGSMEDWRRFKEAGLLDEASMERKDRSALVQRVSKLEKELYDYQHNMGILLLENDKLTSRCGDLEQSVAEATEILKREQRAHLIAISEAEKREENMKKALDLEKKCVVDLEKALREMRKEHEQIKFSSESTRTSTKVCMAQIEDERLEVEGKLFSANAKIAEADRKIAELDMKLKEVENRENTLFKQRRSLEADRNAHEATMHKQKEDLVEWERKLQEREERLCQSRRNLNEREEKLQQSNRSYQQKESELDQIQRKIDSANDTLKQLEEELNRRMEDLVKKEEKAEALRTNLEIREKQLLAMEERLSAKEKVEIQKLLDEHQAVHSSKLQEFEMEMEQKRNTMKTDFETKLQGLQKKEVEITHLEAKLAKREVALEKKSERLKEKTKDIEEKSEALKNKEKYIQAERSKLDEARNSLSAEKECLMSLRNEIETLRENLRKEEAQIDEQSKELKITEERWSEHVRLQSNLKNEMETWRQRNEALNKQLEELKQDRANLEKDWDALDDKRDSVDKELEKLEDLKRSFERFRHTEEEKLKNEKIEMEGRVKQELEAVKLEMETFEAKMKHESLMLAENTRNEHDQMVQDLEQRRRELENDVSNQQEDLNRLREKVREFEETKQKEINNINNLKELAKKQVEDADFREQQLEKERHEAAMNKKQLEQDRFEIGKDIEDLSALSRKLKAQREQLLGERARFLDLIKKLEVCDSCGESTRDFIFSDLHLPTLEEKEVGPSSHLCDLYLRKAESSPDAASLGASDSAGHKSWLQKCASKLFKLSPSKRGEDNSLVDSPTSSRQPFGDERSSAQNVPRTVKEWKLEAHGSENQKSEPSVRIPDAFHVQSVDFSEKVIVEAATEGHAPVNVPKTLHHIETEVPEESEQSSQRVGRKPRKKSTASGVRRTRSVKQVVEDAETFLGKEIKDNDEAPGDSSQIGKQATVRKRGRSKSSVMSGSELNDGDSVSEMADSVSTVGRKKRRQSTATVLPPTPGEKRYNLRRRNPSATQGAAEVSDVPKRSNNIADDSYEDAQTTAQSDEDYNPALSLEVTGDNETSDQGPVATTESVEYLLDRVVRFKMPASSVDVGKSEGKVPVAGIEMPPVEDTSIHDEVNYTEEIAEEDESTFYETEGSDDDGDGDDDGDDSPDHPGEASIGKKLLKFFTT